MRRGKLGKQMKGSKAKNTPVVNTFKLLTGFELDKSLNIFSCFGEVITDLSDQFMSDDQIPQVSLHF